MSAAEWYGVGLASAFTTWILWRLTSLVSGWVIYMFLKHVAYPNRIGPIAIPGGATRLEVMMFVVFSIVNAVSMCLNVHSSDQAFLRSGLISTINMAPLVPVSYSSLISDILGISLRWEMRIQQCFTLISTTQALIHLAFMITRNASRPLDRDKLSGIVALVSMSAVCVASVAFFRRHFYEIYVQTHFLLSLLVCLSLFYHLKDRPSRFYVVGRGVIWLVFIFSRAVNVLYRNFWGVRSLPRAELEYFPKISRVRVLKVTVQSNWNIRAGQYVYLWLPRLSLSAFVQSHPFFIVASDVLESGDKVLSFLVEEERGLTRKLARMSPRGNTVALITGPFGGHDDLGRFGTICMFASGAGVGVQMALIRDVLTRFGQFSVKTRKIVLAWEVEPCPVQMVGVWADGLIAIDKKFALDIICFDPSQKYYPNQEETNLGAPFGLTKGGHENLKYQCVGLDVAKVLHESLPSEGTAEESLEGRGDLAILVCARKRLRDDARRVFVGNMKQNDRLIELDYQPEDYVQDKH